MWGNRNRVVRTVGSLPSPDVSPTRWVRSEGGSERFLKKGQGLPGSPGRIFSNQLGKLLVYTNT